MSIDKLWKDRTKPTFSFEFFPARNEKTAAKQKNVIDNLINLRPDFASVTFGAGGSTREGSYQLVAHLKTYENFEVLAYFASYGLGPDDITSILDDYKNLGVESILCVRGDEPKDVEGFESHPESFKHTSDLVAFCGSRYDFCMGAAGYPEGHKDAANKEKDLQYLKLKIENGAQFIISQYFYDNRFFFDFVKRCRNIGIKVPIIAGIMPIYSIKMMEMLSSLSGATIIQKVRDGLAELPPDDKDALLNFGINYSTQQCRELIENGVDGLHFYTMNRRKSSEQIIKNLRAEGLI